MVLNYSKNDYILLYGIADKSEYESFANEIVDGIRKASSIE